MEEIAKERAEREEAKRVGNFVRQYPRQFRFNGGTGERTNLIVTREIVLLVDGKEETIKAGIVINNVPKGFSLDALNKLMDDMLVNSSEHLVSSEIVRHKEYSEELFFEDVDLKAGNPMEYAQMKGCNVIYQEVDECVPEYILHEIGG